MTWLVISHLAGADGAFVYSTTTGIIASTCGILRPLGFGRWNNDSESLSILVSLTILPPSACCWPTVGSATRRKIARFQRGHRQMLASRCRHGYCVWCGSTKSCPEICHHFDVIRHFDFRDGNLGLQPLELVAIRLNGWRAAGKEGFPIQPVCPNRRSRMSDLADTPPVAAMPWSLGST